MAPITDGAFRVTVDMAFVLARFVTTPLYVVQATVNIMFVGARLMTHPLCVVQATVGVALVI